MPKIRSDRPAGAPASASPAASAVPASPSSPGGGETPGGAGGEPTTAPRYLTPTEVARVETLLAGMTLEQKVGQVMVVGFTGTTVTPEVRAALTDLHAGGIVYFGRNVENPAQLAALSAGLQRIAANIGSPGLIICIDQEGGRVARLRESQGFTEFPSAMAIAAGGDTAHARQVGQAMAEELLALGINLDLAPDLDVNNNPANPIIGPRSFGSDPVRAGEFGVAFMQGLQDAGVAAIGKHFPGHGDTGVDSHFALPVVPHDRMRLNAVEFVPFRAAMAAGIAGIMSAHITFPAVDPTPGLPATLSPKVMTGLVRDEFGYDGLLMTDSLEMGALPSSGFPPPAAAAAALAAGADVLLLSHPHGELGSGPNVQVQAYRRVLDDLSSGKISQARLDQAVRRVLLLKARFGMLAAPPMDPAAADEHIATPAHRNLSRAVAGQAVTLLRDDAHLLPLAEDGGGLVVETPPAAGLGRLLGREAILIALSPSDNQIAAILARTQRGGTVVVATSDAETNPGQVRLIRSLMAAGVPVIVAAVAGPYDLLQFPNAPVYLSTYGSSPPQLEALAAVLRGQAAPAGHLPVDLPGLYRAGDGLTAP